MKMNPFERIDLLNALPKEESSAALKILWGVQEVLSFSEAEHAEFIKITPLPNGSKVEEVRFDKKDVLTEVPFGEKATDIIVETLKSLNEKKKLYFRSTPQGKPFGGTFELHARFVEGKKTPEDLADEAAAAEMKAANKDVDLPRPQ